MYVERAKLLRIDPPEIHHRHATPSTLEDMTARRTIPAYEYAGVEIQSCIPKPGTLFTHLVYSPKCTAYSDTSQNPPQATNVSCIRQYSNQSRLNGIQLWSTAFTSCKEILQRFQSKALSMIVDVPWYVPNTVIRRDLQTRTVKGEIRCYSFQYSARLSAHPNGLEVNFTTHPTTTGGSEDNYQMLCLPGS
jgi:hypothetical protein